MQIEINGQRNITLDFDAPKKFKLFKDGAEVPYIRTGKNSFRLGRGVDGVVELEEVIEKPKIVKPMQLQPQQMALVNPNDVIMINQAAQQLEIEQGLLSETQKQIGYTQEYLDIQQQNINEAVAGVKALETDNAERIAATEGGIFKLAGEIANVENNANNGITLTRAEIESHENADNPHGITKKTIGLDKVDNTPDLDKPISKAVQSALDEKANKTEIDAIREEIGEYQEKNEKISNALSSYTGGLASMSDHRELEGRDFPDQHPIGAITGLQTELDSKVNKTSESSKVYGTDENGQQTTYDVGSFGQVDDVQVGGVSVVTNKIAELGTMAGETASDYSTTAQADLKYATASQGALADTALQPNDNITELTNNAGFITIASVPTAVSQLTNDSNYQTGTQVANSIAVETANRESADNNLQSQIDAIVSSSDVFDIVGTYAELQAYDISTVPVNDIIKVLVDSTHDGAATYYRCVESGGVKSWSYIGSEGAYYTKGEADSIFVPQTRTVNNKALSDNITLTANDVGALPSSTVIPTVNDATVTIQTNGSTVSTFTLNQSSNETVNISVPTKTSDITNDSGFITSADLPTNYVTTNTAQDIDSVKTFLGEKAILFKQKATTNKLGFTLYNPTGTELGAFEWRPNTIGGGALLNINVPYTSSNYVGFRYWGTAVNIIAPKVGTAGNYYIPVNITDGTNTVTANAQGTVNLSTILATKQDVISDLSTIRSGASLGASALQPNDNISELTNNAGYITLSALSGYATESWVGQQGYLTDITSSDVTTALGYTPYNSTNPSGYQANVIETVKVNGTALTPTNKAVDITVPSAVTEATVSGWGFTKNVGTVTSVNNTQPDANGNVTITISDTATWGNINGTLSNQTDLQNALNAKQDALVSGTNIKTIDNISILGSGNIDTANVYWATYGTTTFTDIMTAINAGKLVLCRDTDTSNNDYVYTYRSHTSTTITFYNVSSSSNTIVIVDISNNWDLTDVSFLPSQTSQSGKFLTTNGFSASWATVTIPTVDQTYSASSTNAQSGVAVAQAIAGVPTMTMSYNSATKTLTWS